MATSIYKVLQMPAVAKIILRPNGRAVAQTATHEIGQGTATAMTMIAAEGLGLPIDDVTLEFGDSALPYGGMTVGSMTTLTNGTAIAEAAAKVKGTLLKRVVRDKASALYRSRDALDVVDGWIVSPGGGRERVADHMARFPTKEIEEEAITGRTFGHSKYGRQAFGAQFVKVRINPDTMHLQIERLVGAFAGGRPINPLLVRSQLIGAMVWGIGQALLEESRIDGRRGVWMNRNLGDRGGPGPGSRGTMRLCQSGAGGKDHGCKRHRHVARRQRTMAGGGQKCAPEDRRYAGLRRSENAWPASF